MRCVTPSANPQPGLDDTGHKLTNQVKLTEFGAALTDSGVLSKEDQRAIVLAERAQRGDYDDGKDGRN